MGIEEEVARLARELGITDPAKIKELQDKLKEQFGTDATDIAEKIGEILGKFAKGAVSGGTGIPLDPDLIKKLIEILGPSLADILAELMRKIFGDGSGYDVTGAPPSPYKRVRIKNPTRNLLDEVDKLAPDINLDGSPTIACEPPDKIKITVKVDVVQREEPVYKATALVHGSTGAQVSAQTKYAGKAPLEKLEDNDARSVTFEFTIDCATAARNLGIVIVSILVEDMDGNQTFDMIEVELMSHMLGDDGNCCKTIKAMEDVREGLREGLEKSIRGISSDDLDKLIDRIMPRPAPPAREAPKADAPKTEVRPFPKTLRDMLDAPLSQPLG